MVTTKTIEKKEVIEEKFPKKIEKLPEKLDWDTVGIIVNSMVALKQYIMDVLADISQIEQQVRDNEKEYQRLSNLKEETRLLEERKVERNVELKELQEELGARDAKLKARNIHIPVDDPTIVRGTHRV